MQTKQTCERLTPPLKWHGGKHYLTDEIVSLMPRHTHYVEPFAGGLAVLLAKNPEGVSEVANDLDGNLMNFWNVLRSENTFPRFLREVDSIPFSEAAWEHAGKSLTGENPVSRAVAFFVRCRQSMAGRMDSFAPLSRNRVRRGMNEQASAWLNAVEGLPSVHARLKRVVILNRPAIDVIRTQDGPKTLFYCDPPYLHETRSVPGVYAHEMSEENHRELLDVLKRVCGRVMVSGYPSDLYDRALSRWHRHTFDRPNNAASGRTKVRKTEVVWCNFR